MTVLIRTCFPCISIIVAFTISMFLSCCSDNICCCTSCDCLILNYCYFNIFYFGFFVAYAYCCFCCFLSIRKSFCSDNTSCIYCYDFFVCGLPCHIRRRIVSLSCRSLGIFTHIQELPYDFLCASLCQSYFILSVR